MARHSNTTHANGHRRRQLTARIKATATHCELCRQPLRPELEWPDDWCTVIDEDLPRSRGGSPLDRDNCAALHNVCNRFKGTMTMSEARELLARGATVTKPLKRAQRRAMLATNIGTWSNAASKY